MASAVSPLGTSSTTTNPTGSSTSASNSSLTSTAPSESVFLNLLVAQIQNQDPLNPTDSTQFVSQLAQFSELEQVIAIRGDTDQLAAAATAADPSSTSGASTSGSTGSTTGTAASGTPATSNSSTSL